MAKAKKHAPRPYLKSSANLDLHVGENQGGDSQKAVSDMMDYFVAKGLKRKVVKRVRIVKAIQGLGTTDRAVSQGNRVSLTCA